MVAPTVTEISATQEYRCYPQRYRGTEPYLSVFDTTPLWECPQWRGWMVRYRGHPTCYRLSAASQRRNGRRRTCHVDLGPAAQRALRQSSKHYMHYRLYPLSPLLAAPHQPRAADEMRLADAVPAPVHSPEQVHPPTAALLSPPASRGGDGARQHLDKVGELFEKLVTNIAGSVTKCRVM